MVCVCNARSAKGGAFSRSKWLEFVLIIRRYDVLPLVSCLQLPIRFFLSIVLAQSCAHVDAKGRRTAQVSVEYALRLKEKRSLGKPLCAQSWAALLLLDPYVCHSQKIQLT